MRTGYSRNGDKLNEAMPYGLYKDMSDDDVMALWLYLRTVEPKTAGGRQPRPCAGARSAGKMAALRPLRLFE